jgi:MFS family permease
MSAIDEESSTSDGSQSPSPASLNDVPGQNEATPSPHERWMSGPFIRLLATNMAFGFSTACFYLLPKHLTVSYAATPGMVGAVMGVFGLTCVAIVPWLGRIVGRLGLARTILLSQALMAFAALGFAFVHGVGLPMLMLRTLQGLATAGVMTASVALVCELAPAEKLGQAMGLAGAASLVMNAAAPAVAEPIGARFGFAWVFAMSALAAALGAVAARKLPAGIRHAETTPALAVPRRARPILLALAFTGAGFNVAMAFLAPLALKRGVDAVRGFFLAYTLSALVIRLGGGSLTDRLGLRRTASFGMLVYGAFIAGLAGVGAWTLVPLGIGFGVAHGVLFPALMALLFANADPGERAKLAGFANGVVNVGMFSVLGFGQLANRVGLPAIFALTGGLVAFSAWLMAPARIETTADLQTLEVEPD